MNGIIRKCLTYRCINQMLTSRFVHMLSSSVKSKHLKQKVLITPSIVFQPVTQCQFIPCRTLYYLEYETVKEYKRFPSEYDITQETLKEICLNEHPKSLEEWDDVKMEVMSRCFNLTDENFDSVLMEVLLAEGELELAHSFMDYLKKRKLKPNYVTLCKYMVLCSRNVNRVGQDIILETYEKIISNVDTTVLNNKIVAFLVQGLCATEKWKKSLDYTNQLPKSMLTTDTSNALASAAFRNNEYGLAQDILNTWYKNGVSPAFTVFVDYMNFIINLHRKDPIKAYKCFTHMADYARNRNIIIKEKAVVYIEEYFKRHVNCKTSYAKVSRDGVCSSCQSKLESSVLTKEEFRCLTDSFFKYSVQKSDVFINTTQLEFDKFCRFVEKFKPFTLVLDGLNVAHAGREDRVNRRSLAEQLFNVVNHLSKSTGRILILGRHHMKDWPQPIMQAIRKRAYLFYVSNSSQDDPFLIYGALASGPNCLLLSHDMMRDHKSCLPDPRLVHLFVKWQQSHQVYFGNGKTEDEMVLMGPLKHEIAIQGNMEKGWHVPFDNEIKREPYEELNNWLCIRKQS